MTAAGCTGCCRTTVMSAPRHRHWIGPPDADQAGTPLDDPPLHDVVRAQWRHVQLLRRYGAAVTFDAVLTGFLICGHLWADRRNDSREASRRWTHRGRYLIPVGREFTAFSASRLFAAVYPEAVDLAQAIASPSWRGLVAGDAGQQRRFLAEIGRRLGEPDYQPREHGDAIAHWMTFDSQQLPSRPHTTFPDTREHGATRPPRPSPHSLDRQERSATWFAINRRGGGIILHHRHIRPVLVRDWSPKMDGLEATIWASQSTHAVGRPTAVP